MDWSFVLSCWGSGLATLLAVLKIGESFSASRQALLVDARTDDLEVLNVRITNIAKRPLTIVSVEIAYGVPAEKLAPFYIQSIDPMKLTESDTFSLEIPRSEIIAAASQQSPKQRYRCRVIVLVATTAGRKFLTVLHVPHRIITQPHFENARDWIAADLYVGFPQMESQSPTMPNMK